MGLITMVICRSCDSKHAPTVRRKCLSFSFQSELESIEIVFVRLLRTKGTCASPKMEDAIVFSEKSVSTQSQQ